MDAINIKPEEVAKLLVEKHERALKVTSEEFESYQKQELELDKVAEENKQKRDALNELVQQHKETRQEYYTESKDIRKEFMNQTKKKESMKNIPMEVLILTKQIDQLEWEIQTEATNVDEEKRLVKRIQENLEKLHNYAEMYKEHEDIGNEVKKLTSRLRRKLRKAEEAHQGLLTAVNKSDDHHKNFVEAVMKLRDIRTKRIGFQREVEKHTKAIEHWRKVAKQEGAKVKSEAEQPKKEPEKEPKKDLKKDQKKETNKESKKETKNKPGNTEKDTETNSDQGGIN
jgi:uncharacterized coiled-coil DUF342 family protein